MKNSNKRIILKYSPPALVLELVGVVLILSILYFTVTLYPGLHDSVPKQFSLSGAVTAWGSKQIALLWPMAAVYTYIVLTAVSLLIRRIPDENGHNTKISTTLMIILCAKIVFVVFALVSAYSTMLLRDMPSWSVFIVPVGVICTTIVGITMVRNKNSYSYAIKEAKV